MLLRGTTLHDKGILGLYSAEDSPSRRLGTPIALVQAGGPPRTWIGYAQRSGQWSDRPEGVTAPCHGRKPVGERPIQSYRRQDGGGMEQEAINAVATCGAQY
jgi:hypothetical protein